MDRERLRVDLDALLSDKPEHISLIPPTVEYDEPTDEARAAAWRKRQTVAEQVLRNLADLASEHSRIIVTVETTKRLDFIHILVEAVKKANKDANRTQTLLEYWRKCAKEQRTRMTAYYQMLRNLQIFHYQTGRGDDKDELKEKSADKQMLEVLVGENRTLRSRNITLGDQVRQLQSKSRFLEVELEQLKKVPNTAQAEEGQRSQQSDKPTETENDNGEQQTAQHVAPQDESAVPHANGHVDVISPIAQQDTNQSAQYEPSLPVAAISTAFGEDDTERPPPHVTHIAAQEDNTESRPGNGSLLDQNNLQKLYSLYEHMWKVTTHLLCNMPLRFDGNDGFENALKQFEAVRCLSRRLVISLDNGDMAQKFVLNNYGEWLLSDGWHLDKESINRWLKDMEEEELVAELEKMYEAANKYRKEENRATFPLFQGWLIKVGLIKPSFLPVEDPGV